MGENNLKRPIDIVEKKEYKGVKSIKDDSVNELDDESKNFLPHGINKKEIRNAISLLEGAKRKLKRILDSVT
jgi:hypothetical protein